ncbi:hypothetical protein ABPG73_008531, partial [Tetrahymena malaccensis]
LSNLPKSQIIKNLMNSIQISSLKLNDQSQVVNNIQRFQVVQKMLQSWTNIQQIDFDCFGIGKSKVKIGDEEIDQLASTLIKCQMLQSLILNLNDNKIQDQGMSKLGFALTQCKQLQNLNLFIVGNKFGLKGISTLALAILQCEKIEILKLCDLGFASAVTKSKSFYLSKKGTDAYFAPEVEKGQSRIQSDLYSLGLVLLELDNLNELKENWIDQSTKTEILEGRGIASKYQINRKSNIYKIAQICLKKDYLERTTAGDLLSELIKLHGKPLKFTLTSMILEEQIPQQAQQIFDRINELQKNMQNQFEEYAKHLLDNTNSKIKNKDANQQFTKVEENTEIYKFIKLLVVWDRLKRATLSDIVECNPKKFVSNSQQMKQIKSMIPLKSIENIQKIKITSLQDLHKIKEFQDVEIDLQNQIIKIGDEEIDQLASILIKCQRLQSLNLNLTNNKIQDQGMSKLGFGLILCKQLQNLTLIVTGNKFGLEGLNSLAQAILQCENIQILKLCQDLSFSMIENAKNNQFTSCAHYKIVELKFDELYNQSQEKNDEMINSLDLSRLNMFLLKFSSLQELSIIFKRSFNYIFIDTVLKASIIGIFLQNCQNLQSLDIDFDYCQVSQDELSKTFQIFANIKYLKCLSLSLKNTQVSPLGLTSLAIFLRKCLFLQDLNLSFKEKNYSKQIQVRFKQSVLKIKKLIQYQVLFC